MNAVAGTAAEQLRARAVPLRPDATRLLRPDTRVHDMDLGGIWAAVNFPSMITGFCGRVYSSAKDPELGLATTRAYNDWMVEEWWQQHPDRFIPLGITYLADPDQAAAEIRRNAARGFVAVTFPERPHKIGFPSIFDDAWDPVMRACADTDTVICQHVGSSGTAEVAPGAPSGHRRDAVRPARLTSCAEWVWSGWPLRYPNLKIAMSRGRARLGRDAARPPRLHGRPRRVPVERLRTRRAPRLTSCSATSGSAPSRTGRPSTPATASAWST